jgi:nicotinamidase-related amidase
MDTRNVHFLDAATSMLLIVDHQVNLYDGIVSHKPSYIKNNMQALATGASLLDIPVVLTAISPQTNGPTIPEITELFPDLAVINRGFPSFDAFDEQVVLDAVRSSGRTQVVVTGLWTSMCMSFTAQRGLQEGFEVFGVMDTSGSEALDAYNMAVQRMIHAGVVPCTWMQTVSEWMDNWLHPRAGEMYEKVYCAYSKGNPFFEQRQPEAAAT